MPCERRPVLDTVRHERLLMEQLNEHLLFRWCVGLHLDDFLWDPSTVSNNRTLTGGGGGVSASTGSVTILNSTISGNSARSLRK